MSASSFLNSCGLEMNYKCPVESRTRMNTEDKMLLENTCEKSSMNRVFVDAHPHGHKSKGPSKSRECDQPFMEAGVLSKHTTQCQTTPEDMKFSCGICNKIFASEGKLSTHQKTHSDRLNGTEVSNRAGQFPCDICGHIFKTNKKVKEHQRMHTGEKPFSCDMCGKSFSRQDRLKIHKRYHTGERPYKCPHCDKNFTENSTLYRHLATHDKTEKKPFSCDLCPKSFSRKFQLRAHISSHVGQKKNKCNYCDKCFAAPSLLKEHLRIHSGEKPFPCPVCSKHFRNLAHVKRHMVTHTKPKPFQCIECDKVYGLQVRLENHVRRTGHTGNNQYGCPHCKRTFRKKSNFSNHVRSHKKIKQVKSLASEKQEECATEKVPNLTSGIVLCELQPSGPAENDSNIIGQHDSVIQVLICTNEGKVAENNVDFANTIPAADPDIGDEELSGSPAVGNCSQDLSTVVILLQNGLQNGAFEEPSENIQTEILE